MGCGQGGECSLHPKRSHSTSRPEDTSGWPCLDRRFFLLLPIIIKHRAGRRKSFCTWEEASLGVSITVPPQTASGQGPAVTPGCVTMGSEKTPGQDLGVDTLAGAINNLMQKESTPISAKTPASPLASQCRSENKHLLPKLDWAARSQV